MTARVVQTHESPKRLARRTLPRAEWVMLMCVGVVSAAPTVDMYMTLYKIARGVGQEHGAGRQHRKCLGAKR